MKRNHADKGWWNITIIHILKSNPVKLQACSQDKYKNTKLQSKVQQLFDELRKIGIEPFFLIDYIYLR